MMSETIDPQQVLQVAKLARISISDDELTGSSQQLNEVLRYVKQLQRVNISDDVEPFFGATESVNSIRPDQRQPSTDREIILDNAPDADGEFYRVPPVFK